ncbi:CLUMA_CG007114, isoform A [Clunio marinus]|uniref:CLUMA_CG007114, isoform A n=1 Tax=Clunio marinus TaxID=568069 RepID=A0A1J1HZY1_9DIPT|nr:CLUMA_CG007114, isoform A [Clunio marinus]
MKLLHLFLVVIIAEEVFSGDGNSCSTTPLPFSRKQKKIDEITASIYVTSFVLLQVLQTILGQIATEINSSLEYLNDVATQQVDPVDFPISCIAELLIGLNDFMESTFLTLLNAATEVVGSIDGF